MKHTEIALVIAEKLDWPKPATRNSARKLINGYLDTLNAVDIKYPKAFVYFIQSGGFIKIGVAVNVLKRVKDLQTGNPNNISLVAHINARSKQHAYSIENQLHRKFASYNKTGEWFHRKIIPKMLFLHEKVIWNGKNHAVEIISNKGKY